MVAISFSCAMKFAVWTARGFVVSFPGPIEETTAGLSRQSRLKSGSVLCCASPYVVAQRCGHDREHCYPELKKTHSLSPSVPWHLFCSAQSVVTPVTLELMRFRWRSRGWDAAADLGAARVSHIF